jgi:adenylate cyclase
MTLRDEATVVIDWLLDEGRRVTDPGQFLDAFAAQVRRCGIDVARITTGVPLLHPQLFSFSGLWELGKPPTERTFKLETVEKVSALDNSPIRLAYSGEATRLRLTDPFVAGEFPIATDLRREGYTDYLVLPVPFGDGTFKALSLATRRTGGFSDDEIALFRSIVPAFSINLEVQTLRRTARTLLDTYVGRQSGGRVLAGQIRRGMGETIRAVIWLCDLRDFTALSEKLQPDALIGTLDKYFGAVAGAVEKQGGEVLKFIGDAMLAIFPVEADGGAACRSALHAAADARETLAEENRARAAERLPPIAYGIALHVGDVLYGNVGSETRLDFTVIGPAVNLTSRIESLCKTTGRPLLLSEDFVRLSGLLATSVGKFELKGVGGTQRVFAPASSQAQ